MIEPSFAALAKQEICENPLAHGIPRAEFAAMICCGALIEGTSDQMKVSFRTESAPVAARIIALSRTLSGIEPEVHHMGSKAVTVSFADGAALLGSLRLGADPEPAFPSEYLKDRQGRISIVRGAFLAGGTVSNPAKGYHLEFVTLSAAFSDLLIEALQQLDVAAKRFQRKGCHVIYLSEGDSIASLLALVGAHTSILDFENVRILKETRNNVNRAVNCETANINRSVEAAMAQIHSIELIERRMGLAKLSAALQEAARLRLQYPEATLQELCELSGTTKSGMNHRLRKINAIARDISGEE